MLVAPWLAPEQRSRFYSSLSHVFRNPLVGATGYLDFLFKGYAGQLTQEQLGQLACVRDAVLQLQRVVDAFLDVVAFDLGVVQLSLERVDLNQFLAGLEHDLRTWVSSEHRTLHVQVAPSDLQVHADPKWLRVLLHELLTNAVRVSPAGSSIELVLACKDGQALLRCSDQGHGVPAHMLAWMFQPLAQFLRRGDPPKGERGGLGLPLARSIAEAHRGRMWAELRAERGLSVVTALPLADREGIVRPGPLNARHRSPPERRRRSPPTLAPRDQPAQRPALAGVPGLMRKVEATRKASS